MSSKSRRESRYDQTTATGLVGKSIFLELNRDLMINEMNQIGMKKFFLLN